MQEEHLEIKKADLSQREILFDLVMKFVEDNKERSGLGDKYYELFGGDHVENRNKYVDSILNNQDGECLIAYYDSKPVGYSYVYFTEDFKVCSLDEIYVVKEYRGKGIGTALFNKVDEWVKDKSGRMRVEVFTWNTEGCKFYEGKGLKLDSHVYTNY